MHTEIAILVAFVFAVLALGGAPLTSLPAPWDRAALAVALCGNVALALFALLGPDDQLTLRLLAAAGVAAAGAAMLPDAPVAHTLLAGGAGIIVVDRLRRALEPVFTPDRLWAVPGELREYPAWLAWATALVAGTLLVCALRSSEPLMRLAVAAVYVIVAIAAGIVLPHSVVLVLLTALPLGVALVPGRPQPWLA